MSKELSDNLNLIKEYLDSTNAPFRYKEAFISICIEVK